MVPQELSLQEKASKGSTTNPCSRLHQLAAPYSRGRSDTVQDKRFNLVLHRGVESYFISGVFKSLVFSLP